MRARLNEILLDCLRLMLRPMAQFCIRHAIKFQEFSDIAKGAFLSAAVDELSRENEAATVSKLSVMTGLQRRDIAGRVSGDTSQREVPPSALEGNVITKIIGQWSSDPQFCTPTGKPKVLPTEGKTSAFAKLVRAVNSDLNHHTILFELERIGVVVRENGAAVLRGEAFLPSNNVNESFRLLAQDTRDLTLCVEENSLYGTTPPHLHATTSYDNIPEQHLPEIRRWFLSLGKRVHREARRYLSAFDKDISKKQRAKRGAARVVIGTFSFVERRAPRER